LIPLDPPALRRRARLTLALMLSLALAGPAAASPETFKRGLGNVLFGPMDIALSPVVGSMAVFTNLQDVDDTLGVRVFYVVPGLVWNTFIGMGGGLVRTLAGAFEFVPGVFLFFFEADLDPLFAPVERSDALVDEELDLIHLKFGVNYVD
jgi:hypothetical protein